VADPGRDGPGGQATAGQVMIADPPTPLADLMHILGWDNMPGVVVLEARQ
jgi:hypothetical protein